MEILPGIHQLKVPIPNNPLGWVLPYLIEDNGSYTMVDSGWNTPESFDALIEEMKRVGVPLSRVSRLLVTHVHPDHYGLAGRVKEVSGAEVVIHQREKDFIRSRYWRPGHLLRIMAEWLLSHGVPRNEMPEMQAAAMPVRHLVVPVEPDAVLWGGETLAIGRYRFEVFWTPGHSPGHVCLYDRGAKVILTGDHVLPTITPNVSLHPQQTGNPLGDYIASLKRLESLEVEQVLPAHEYAFTDLHGRIREIVEHHQHRLGEMLTALNERPKTAYEVAGSVTWVTGRFEDFDPWMKRAAVSETLAHLEYLVVEDQADSYIKDGVVYYQRTREAEPSV